MANSRGNRPQISFSQFYIEEKLFSHDVYNWEFLETYFNLFPIYLEGICSSPLASLHAWQATFVAEQTRNKHIFAIANTFLSSSDYRASYSEKLILETNQSRMSRLSW